MSYTRAADAVRRSISMGDRVTNQVTNAVSLTPTQRETMSRAIFLGAGAESTGFCGNKIRTSKYTALTFVPVNTIEQLHKFGNMYFLVVSVLMYLGEITPLFVGTIKGFTTLLTLLAMMAISALVALLDDRRRVAADVETNNQEAECLSLRGTVEKRPWEKVCVGDLLVVRDGGEFPADMVALYLSGHDGGGYVSTANLDGETNLKLKAAAFESQSRLESEAMRGERFLFEEVCKLKGKVEAEAPQANIHDFKGRLVMGADSESLDLRSFMLRGTRLRNTKICCGVVVYTGPDTRVIRNSREAPLKQSNLEVVTNRVMVVLLVAQGALALLSMVLYMLNRNQLLDLWYLPPKEIWLPEWIAYWLTFFVLYSNMMPISLYPTMEWCNSFQTAFIKCDQKMYWRELDFPANARASNLCQELGQVSYIFSDKTGTLTQNVMELKRFWVAGATYGEMSKERGFTSGAEVQAARAGSCGPDIDRLLEVLAVAHTTVLSETGGQRVLEGESPDEIALVETAAELGWRYDGRQGFHTTPSEGRHGTHSTVSTKRGADWEVKQYEILAVNAFDSARKRMSAVVERDGRFFLFAKGADNVMLERASASTSKPELDKVLHDFATEGLRTLVIGGRELPAADAQDWMKKFKEAQQCMDDREGALTRVAERIEVDLDIYGITAIEDKLQDQVPETIMMLREAGIKLWVLTGDKLETAKNIGYSSRVLLPEATILELDMDAGVSPPDATLRLMEKLKRGGIELMRVQQQSHRALMVTGSALLRILEHEDNVKVLLSVAQSCSVVIACRVSPLQKAQVVRMVREGVSPSPVTLAVGDGANDVPMIQEAQVGVGIAGREGRQAVNNSDFAIGQFQYLQRLLLVHGRWNYRRACKFTLFTFWRNSVQVLLIFYYTFACGYSGTVLFEDWLRISFNFLCSFPIMATGCFDQDITDSTALKNPWTYVFGREGLDLNVRAILESLALAVVHSLLIAVVLICAYPSFELLGAGDYYTFGTVAYVLLVVQMNYRVAFINCTHNLFTVGALMFSFVCLLLYLLIYTCTPVANLLTTKMYMTTWHFISIWPFWFLLYTLPMLGLAVDSLVLVIQRTRLASESHCRLNQLRRESYKEFNKHATDKDKCFGGMIVRVPADPDHKDEETGRSPQPRPPLPGESLMADARTSRQVAAPMWQQSRRGFQVSFKHRVGPFEVRCLPVVCFVIVIVFGLIVITSCAGLRQLHLHYAGSVESVPQGTYPFEVIKESSRCNGESDCVRFTVKVPHTMRPPILVYYKVGPFFQNFYAYMKGEATNELMGQTGAAVERRRETRCAKESRKAPDGREIVPCGMLANTMFNDYLVIDGVNVHRTDIAWASDIGRYDNPEDYLKRPNTRWLNETYKGAVLEQEAAKFGEEGVKFEPFLVWIRPSIAPWATKRYGWIKEDLEKDRVLTITIYSKFPVDAENGYKQFALTEVGLFGGRDLGLGLCLAISAALLGAVFVGALHVDEPNSLTARGRRISETAGWRAEDLSGSLELENLSGPNVEVFNTRSGAPCSSARSEHQAPLLSADLPSRIVSNPICSRQTVAQVGLLTSIPSRSKRVSEDAVIGQADSMSEFQSVDASQVI